MSPGKGLFLCAAMVPFLRVLGCFPCRHVDSNENEIIFIMANVLAMPKPIGPASAILKKVHAKNKGVFLCAAMVSFLLVFGCFPCGHVDSNENEIICIMAFNCYLMISGLEKSVKELKSSCRSIPQIQILFSSDPRGALNRMEGTLQRYEVIRGRWLTSVKCQLRLHIFLAAGQSKIKSSSDQGSYGSQMNIEMGLKAYSDSDVHVCVDVRRGVPTKGSAALLIHFKKQDIAGSVFRGLIALPRVLMVIVSGVLSTQLGFSINLQNLLTRHLQNFHISKASDGMEFKDLDVSKGSYYYPREVWEREIKISTWSLSYVKLDNRRKVRHGAAVFMITALEHVFKLGEKSYSTACVYESIIQAYIEASLFRGVEVALKVECSPRVVLFFLLQGTLVVVQAFA
uniref:Uncharacterized protein n=1 Tax=Tanacetum cinerariifolium TaxID=118510 RepID=A0A699HJ32_TANCI|nr:hypothetical protein [Tanacetum cinerariifolium]